MRQGRTTMAAGPNSISPSPSAHVSPRRSIRVARVTNITSMDLQVPALGDRVVKAGETVEVDDELVGTYVDEHGDTIGNVWPESNWTVEGVGEGPAPEGGEG